MAVLIFLDGVLRRDSATPIRQGLGIYRSLNQAQRVLVLANKRAEAERWFKENNLNKLDDIVSSEDLGIDTDFKLVDHCRSQGRVDYVVTADVELATTLLEQGINTVLFLEPKYIRPEFRPDGRSGSKTWASLIAELDRQQQLYDNDPRLADDDWYGYEE